MKSSTCIIKCACGWVQGAYLFNFGRKLKKSRCLKCNKMIPLAIPNIMYIPQEDDMPWEIVQRIKMAFDGDTLRVDNNFK